MHDLALEPYIRVGKGPMSKYLMVDIGAGTMDVLYFDDESGLHYKAVAKSPVMVMAETAADLHGNLLVTGCEMGGGTISRVLTERTREAEVVMTAAAAMTVHHDLNRVRAAGIRIIQRPVPVQPPQRDCSSLHNRPQLSMVR